MQIQMLNNLNKIGLSILLLFIYYFFNFKINYYFRYKKIFKKHLPNDLFIEIKNMLTSIDKNDIYLAFEMLYNSKYYITKKQLSIIYIKPKIIFIKNNDDDVFFKTERIYSEYINEKIYDEFFDFLLEEKKQIFFPFNKFL